MAIASVALVYSLWVVPYIPMQDGPQHVLSAHIENHYSDPGSLYPEFYRVLPQFAGKGFALVYGPLETFLPWRVALRVTLSFFALAFAWGFALVVLALDRTPRARATAVLGFAIALPWSLYMGFFAFVAGSTLGLFTLAFYLHASAAPLTPRRRAMLAGLLLLQGVFHVFTAILTGVIIAVLGVMNVPKAERPRELVRLALVGSPAAVLLVLTYVFRDVRASSQQDVEPWSVAERLGEVSRWFLPGPGLRAWLVLALVAAGIGVALVRARRGAATPIEKGLAGLALAFVLLTLATPLHVPGWQFLAPRFAILATVLGLALVRLPEQLSARAMRLAVPAVTALCVVSALLSASLHRRLASGCSDALSGLDAPLKFHGPRLPIVIDAFCGLPRDPTESPIPRAAMAYETPLLYLVDHGGIAPRLFAGSPSVHAVARKPTAPLPPPPDPAVTALAEALWLESQPKLRTSVMTELAADAMPFEGIHVVGGRPDDALVFAERGFVTEHLQGSLFIARFEGCPSELVLPPGALDREPVFYEYGLFFPVGISPEPRTAMTKEIDRKTPISADGQLHVPLAGKPCGELWLRVVWDVDSSSGYSRGDRTCKGAMRDGRMLARVSRDHPLVTCTPLP